MATPGKKINTLFLHVLWMLFVLFILGNINAQDKKNKLEQDKKKIEDEIRYNSQLLEETTKSKKINLNQLVIIKNQIASREKLIETLHNEVKTVDEQIGMNREILKELQGDLDHLKEEYAIMIYYAYKNRSSFDRLMFIFASEDFNQAFRRIKYFEQYTAYRKTQSQLILNTKTEIDSTNKVLEIHKQEKLVLLTSLKDERDLLARERSQLNNVYQSLISKEKELAKTIKLKETAAKKLQGEIESMIAEEIRLASKKSGTTKTGSFALTPDEMLLSANFQENMGGLPWPVEKGVISSTFGEHFHPVLKNVKTKNNGVDILTDESMKTRAVFGGEVTRVVSIPNYNYVVMLRHGEYLTVYSNLSEVYVKKGDKVETKQTIGKVFTDKKEMKTEIHFELWKGKTLLNPANWLAK
jgi:septal ring factor EnvC (AmiA/AmiB activator)